MTKAVKHTAGFWARALLNSYSVLFFSNNRLFALLLLVVSFFNPYAGITGLIAVLIAIGFAGVTGLYQPSIRNGTYSYNALIIGIGMGTLYQFGSAFWLLLVVLVMLSVILSAVLQSRLSKYGLPFLTIPFVLCLWILTLVSKDFEAIDFSTRNIYWLNDLYAIGDQKLLNLIMFMDKLDMPPLVSTFFRALSSLYFQNNLFAGLLIAAGILIHSRIIFSLIIIGFATAYGFNQIVMAHPEGMNYYLIGGNFILVSVAVGGFFVVPSLYSYLWAILSVPITFLMVMGLGRITGQWGLPVYSMPFCITVLSLLYFFSLKAQKGKLVLTPLQFFSPEKNLYNYINSKGRLQNMQTIRLQLPFIGKWLVSQGYDGNITHKDDWGKALDFMIVDDEMRSYNQYASEPEHFYCFGKPILAPADGWVEEVTDNIEDNEIGKINRNQNWGNSIVIKHAEGLYTKLSHLRKHSVKVKPGEYIKQGTIIAACGNSGRSPEPHLHFQVQTTPYIGSKTIAYPIAHYALVNKGETEVREFGTPAETEMVFNTIPNTAISKAYEFLPGYNVTVEADGFEEGKWEVFTDAYNQTYLYCHVSGSVAYFKRDQNLFYFTSFDGDKKSLLYYFYLASYKIYFATEPVVAVTDKFPLQLTKNTPVKWLQDLVAPFFIFSRLHYTSVNRVVQNHFLDPVIAIESKQELQFLHFQKTISTSTIDIHENRIASFCFLYKGKQIKTVCTPKNF